jgi:hypothetical protein
MRASLSASALCIATALLATGCGPFEHTHAIIEIKTDIDCASMVDVTIDLIGSDGNQKTAANTSQCSGGRIGSLVLLPPDATEPNAPSSASGQQRDSHFDVVITAGVEIAASECEANGFFGCIVARRRLEFTSKPVEILLTEDCLHNPCEDSTTCVSGGECGPFVVDYDTCDEVCDESDLVETTEGS